MSNVDELGGVIARALTRPVCDVLFGGGRAWETPNSTVMSIPALPLAELGQICEARFATTSIVRVSGTTPEPLHYHTTHVVGLVVDGSGILRMVTEAGANQSKPVVAGDIVVIPKGALHVFETLDGGDLAYIAFEFSDGMLDYQAHWSEI